MGYDVLQPLQCECGCGQYAATDQRRNRVSRFLPGHNGSQRGRTFSASHRAKIREARARQTNVGGGGPVARPDAERFLGHVEIPGTCWEWTGALNPRGYGSFGVGSKRDGSAKVVRAHRFAYEFWVGPIPEGLEIDHLCNNRSCVNPDHLEPVTHVENIRRATDRRRTNQGGQ